MGYTQDFKELQQIFQSLVKNNKLETIELKEYEFESSSYKVLPGAGFYHCDIHNTTFEHGFSFYNEVGTTKDHVHVKDINIKENRFFKYHLVTPSGNKKNKKVIFLFHGFNEKDWTKYLPWAKEICEGTGSTVVLFPIAFHMQRAPKYWSNKRAMYKLSLLRKERFPNVVNSTLSNVAISMRLHSMPQRFIWSGLQTYYDVIQLIEECKQGNHEYIHPNFEFDMFGYSIGGFLAQILKLTNYKHYFDNVKVCLFCSGATFNRLSPVSKFILDSEANVALYSFFVEHFDKILQKDEVLNHYINSEDHLEGKVFHSMLDYQNMRKFREGLLRKYKNDVYAISLKRDTVIPSFEIINTLKGAYRDIQIDVDELDFTYEYTHENPFPLNKKDSASVDENFHSVFAKVCRFLNDNSSL